MRPEVLLERAGLPPVEPRSLAGGDVGVVWRCGDAVVKTRVPTIPGMFLAEARGLRRLAAAGARVPEVLHADEDGIVLTWLEPGTPDPEALGRLIARLHQDRSGVYGSPEPLWLGSVPLPAGETEDPTEALVALRLRPLLRRAAPALGTLVTDVEHLLERLSVPSEGPSLVHGDLWSGNVLHTTAGPALIDPSVQRAPRAYDLAMMELFGGFDGRCRAAYEEVWPTPDEVRASLPAFRLVFLLVHAAMFGSGWAPAVERTLRELT
ncbi:MAG: fructosamine kinase family protein [Alphaproteobacteria bacterium]|nr:fructosamine kinase family protein [Alphaproteobacteria bacterium]